MFTYNFTHNQTYSENFQVNPIRWRLLYREDETTFSDQGNWMKCKDFFNDVVAGLKGTHFSVYHFDNHGIKKNEEGLYVLVNNLAYRDVFFHNIETVINKHLEEDLGCRVEMLADVNENQAILIFPPQVLESTYYVSLLTLLIRGCNYYKKPARTIGDLFDFIYKKEGSGSYAYLQLPHIERLKQVLFNVPKAKDYWWYYNERYNSHKEYPGAHTLHNNGCLAWITNGAVDEAIAALMSPEETV